MNAPINTKLKVWGLQRSGNHAIINWIIQSTSGPTCFLNNVESGTDPYIGNKGIEVKKINWESSFGISELRKAEKNLLIISYEDCPLNCVKRTLNDEEFTGASQKELNVLILRDPYNFMASRCKWMEVGAFGCKIQITDDASWQRVVNLWKDYAREYLRETKHLGTNFLAINYNKWFKDAKYRSMLSEQLNMSSDENALKVESDQGGGSSFHSKFLRIYTLRDLKIFADPKSYLFYSWKGKVKSRLKALKDTLVFHGVAEKMNVFNRWERYKKDERFKKLFNDKDLREYSNRVFGNDAAFRFH